MQTKYRHLGTYSDLVEAARQHHPLYPLAKPGAETQQRVREVIGWCDRPAQPWDVQVDRRWEANGLSGEEISWWVGYGPRTKAWLFKPSGAAGALPAVLALHDHGGFKFYGREKIADGPDAPEPFIEKYHELYYGGRAWVNALAKAGFAVLVHDTFLWGSRKFPVAEMREALNQPKMSADALELARKEELLPAEVAEYNFLAAQHEHIISKYCNLLGTGMPGVVCYEDRVALNYLRSRTDVQAENIACMGLSGGGNRSGMLMATDENLKAGVVVGLMSTYEGLLDHNVATHTWMFFPFAWGKYGDWPDLVACRAPRPLLVQYDLDDALFTQAGMKDAHDRLNRLYESVNSPKAYTGQFYPGVHKFDLAMQSVAFAWLKDQLA